MPELPRELAYRDRFVWELQQTVESQFDTIDDFTDRYIFPDMTTKVPFVLYLNQTEWTTLYSAILTGADLSFPNTSHDVEYLYLQSVADPLAQLCAALAECIRTDTDVQSALLEYLGAHPSTGGTGNPEQPVETIIRETDMLPVGYGCTDDLAFGMSVAIVDAIHQATNEVLQAIEVLTNPLEIASELADNVPGVGALATAVDVANWIQDTADEEYQLAWSTVVRDDLACILWCMWKFDCELSFETIFDMYIDTALELPPVSDTLAGWVAWLILLPFTDATQTVAAISMLGLIAMRFGGKFAEFALGIQSLDTVVKLNHDASNSNWSILCDDCIWCLNTDWTAGADGWGVVAGSEAAGVLTASGWDTTDIMVGDESRRAIYIERTGTASNFTKLELINDLTKGTYHVNSTCFIFITELSTVRTDVLKWTNLQTPNGTDQAFTWTDAGGEMCDYIAIFLRVSFQYPLPAAWSGSALYKSLELCGDGTKPVDWGGL